MEDRFKIVRKLFRTLDTPGAHITRALLKFMSSALLRHIARAVKYICLGLSNRSLHAGISVFVPVSKTLIQESEDFNVGGRCLLNRTEKRHRDRGSEK